MMMLRAALLHRDVCSIPDLPNVDQVLFALDQTVVSHGLGKVQIPRTAKPECEQDGPFRNRSVVKQWKRIAQCSMGAPG